MRSLQQQNRQFDVSTEIKSLAKDLETSIKTNIKNLHPQVRSVFSQILSTVRAGENAKNPFHLKCDNTKNSFSSEISTHDNNFYIRNFCGFFTSYDSREYDEMVRQFKEILKPIENRYRNVLHVEINENDLINRSNDDRRIGEKMGELLNKKSRSNEKTEGNKSKNTANRASGNSNNKTRAKMDSAANDIKDMNKNYNKKMKGGSCGSCC